jgi:hypothetical protein
VFKCTYFNIKGIMFQFQLRMYVHDWFWQFRQFLHRAG